MKERGTSLPAPTRTFALVDLDPRHLPEILPGGDTEVATKTDNATVGVTEAVIPPLWEH